MDDDKNIFERLQQIRIDSGLKLKGISSQSKIQIKYLEALEAGQLENIPPVYDYLFFKTYLSFLNLENEQFFLDEFNKIRRQHKTESPSTIKRKMKFEKESHNAKYLKVLYISLPVFVVLILIAFLIYNSTSVKPMPDEGINEISVQQIVDTLNAHKALAAKMLPKSDSVVVKITAVEKTWLRVIADLADTSEYLLAKGQLLHLKADSTLQFLVGNAAGLDFTVNNIQQGIVGKEDEVIAFMKITRKGIVAKKLKKIARKGKK